MLRFFTLIALLAAVALQCAHAELRLPSVFSDHMVLQRDAEIRVWGWADAEDEVTVTFAGDSVTAKADKNGRWKLELPRKVASFKPQALVVKAGSNELTIDDVLIGEVWIASGQSNMEWNAKRGVQPADQKVIHSGPVDGIRLLQVPKISQGEPQNDQPAKWTLCTVERADKFSAVGYFFARQLREKLDVPIGIINSSWGGTPIQSWIPTEGWKALPSVEQLLKLPTEKGKVHQRQHTALYNGMIAPLAPLSVRGFIWYQGEANRREHAMYRDYMEALITGWRTAFKNENAPFYFVQLAPYIYGKDDPTNLPAIQNAQRLAAETIPKCRMAVTTDIGDLKNIHPRNKSEVGRRLSLLALKYAYLDYGIEGPEVAEGPWPRKAHTIFENIVSVGFYDQSPLKLTKGVSLNHFEVAGPNKKFQSVNATLEPSSPFSVILDTKGIDNPKYVRYLWNQEWITNLENKAGLPASPFLIDVEPAK